MTIPVTLRVNGETHEFSVGPTEMLIDVLRRRHDLTGTNRDCGMGICGVCTVLLDGRPVSSCKWSNFQAKVPTPSVCERRSTIRSWLSDCGM